MTTIARPPSLGSSAGRSARVVCLALGSILLAGMSIGAHALPYFPIDLPISRGVQAYHPEWLDMATGALSWLGFPPQNDVLFGLVVVALFALGARWAVVMELVVAVGSGGLYFALEQLVQQPRPSAELVRVAAPLPMGAFPSGHLVTFTAVFGFVAFLGYRYLAPAATRWLPVALVTVFLLLLSFARIYAGQHWASDVLGGWLLGGLWLAVAIDLYRWGHGRFSRHPGAGGRRVPTNTPADAGSGGGRAADGSA